MYQPYTYTPTPPGPAARGGVDLDDLLDLRPKQSGTRTGFEAPPPPDYPPPPPVAHQDPFYSVLPSQPPPPAPAYSLQQPGMQQPGPPAAVPSYHRESPSAFAPVSGPSGSAGHYPAGPGAAGAYQVSPPPMQAPAVHAPPYAASSTGVGFPSAYAPPGVGAGWGPPMPPAAVPGNQQPQDHATYGGVGAGYAAGGAMPPPPQPQPQRPPGEVGGYPGYHGPNPATLAAVAPYGGYAQPPGASHVAHGMSSPAAPGGGVGSGYQDYSGKPQQVVALATHPAEGSAPVGGAKAKSQEEEDREQLEKIIRLRKELEREQEKERQRREELETWPCKECTFRNKLDAKDCEMCGTGRPGYAASATASTTAATSGPRAVAYEPRTSYVTPAPSTIGTLPTTTSTPAPRAGPTAWICGVCGAPNEAKAQNCILCNSYQKNGMPIQVPAGGGGTAPRQSFPETRASDQAAPQKEDWVCSVCTLHNPISVKVCKACESGVRPLHLAPPSGKHRKKASSGGEATDTCWPCPTCTFSNQIVRERCEMCQTERPSKYKPPMAMPVPSTDPKANRKAQNASSDDDEAVQWQEDLIATSCNRCNLQFGLTRRRHHCRACGFVFCHACSPFRTQVKKNGPEERVCIECYTARHPAGKKS